MAEEKKDPKEQTPGEYVHTRTIRQIVQEAGKKAKETKEVKEVKETPKEIVEDKPIEEPKVIEEDKTAEIAKQAAQEAATKVAEETKKSFQEEINKILDKDKDIQDKQKEADALIASWDKEKRLPKDYQELIAETMRIADAKMEQRFKEKQAADEQTRQELATKEAQNQEELAKKQGEDRLQEFNKQIAQDLDELYGASLLPRPSKFENINDSQTNDEAAKETQELLKFGVDLNTRLVKEGKQPVTSLSKIYFLHYKPQQEAGALKTKEVAGADAPVSGARNTPPDSDSSKLDYQRLHKETWAQTMYRIAREQAAKMAGK